MLYSTRAPVMRWRTYSSPKVKLGMTARWRRPARCSTMRRRAGAPARGPVSCTSCALAEKGATRRARPNSAIRICRRLMTFSLLGQPVVDGEREEQGHARVEHDVVHEGRALGQP